MLNRLQLAVGSTIIAWNVYVVLSMTVNLFPKRPDCRRPIQTDASSLRVSIALRVAIASRRREVPEPRSTSVPMTATVASAPALRPGTVIVNPCVAITPLVVRATLYDGRVMELYDVVPTDTCGLSWLSFERRIAPSHWTNAILSRFI